MNARNFRYFDKSFTIQPNLIHPYSGYFEYYAQVDFDKKVSYFLGTRK